MSTTPPRRGWHHGSDRRDAHGPRCRLKRGGYPANDKQGGLSSANNKQDSHPPNDQQSGLSSANNKQDSHPPNDQQGGRPGQRRARRPVSSRRARTRFPRHVVSP
ncbi:hypothetical protein Abr02nite_58980 [Paractinoplanes brasiliensis]|nr:hypothetical protein Abr02nite_58980 [Actinoplanes brasiliensis]